MAIVTTAGLIVVALIANRSRQHAKAARTQVENDHTTNLRVEGDDRHLEILESLKDLKKDLSGVKSDIRGVRRDIGRLADSDLSQWTAIRDLEDTRPKHPEGG